MSAEVRLVGAGMYAIRAMAGGGPEVLERDELLRRSGEVFDAVADGILAVRIGARFPPGRGR